MAQVQAANVWASGASQAPALQPHGGCPLAGEGKGHWRWRDGAGAVEAGACGESLAPLHSAGSVIPHGA